MKDSKRALACDPKNIKAAWRGAKAALALKKYKFAMDFIYEGLKNGKNNDLMQLKQQIETQMKKERQKETQKTETEKEIKEKENLFNLALKKRNLVRGEKDIFNIQKMYKDLPQYDHQTDTICWPVLLIYPAYEKSDFVQSFDENDNLLSLLETVFEEGSQPLSYDTKNVLVYENIKNLRVFVQTNAESRIKNQRWVSLDLNLPIKKVLVIDEYHIPFIPVFYVLDNSQIEEFLEKYD